MGGACGRSGVYLHLGSPKQARYKRQSGLFRIDLPSGEREDRLGLVREMHITAAVPIVLYRRAASENGSALLLQLLARCPQILQRALQRLHLFTRVA